MTVGVEIEHAGAPAQLRTTVSEAMQAVPPIATVSDTWPELGRAALLNWATAPETVVVAICVVTFEALVTESVAAVPLGALVATITLN